MTGPEAQRLAQRFAVMLGGEVLQSLFHFGLNLALVRALSAHDYGLFAMVFGLAAVALTFVRAVAGVPAATFIPQARSGPAARALAVSFGTGAVVSALALGLLTALAFAPFVGAGALAAGALVTAWSLRSFLRTLLIVRGRAGVAGLSDLAYAVSGMALLGLLLWGEPGALLWDSLWLLAVAHGIGLVAALAILREPIRIDLRRAGRRYRRLWRAFAWSVAATATANLQGQGPMLLVGLLAGPAAYAPIAAVLVLFSPLRLLGTVVVNLTQPEMARLIAAGETRRLRRVAAAGSAALTAACLGYGGAILVLAGPIEAHLFAGRFAQDPFVLIVGLVWATVTLTMLYAGPKTLIETRLGFRDLAAMALASATVGMVLVTALVVLVAPAWSMAGVAISEIIVLVWCWRRAPGRAGATPAPRAAGLSRLVPALVRRLP
ncbi:lipopolysaccharide biosynthesis protein [Methylobacterium sp. Leaf118]|uniref:lipopolysaccharide biosynthesis protein n=1 Tax=Methylobacterium sp. Leaf118 TaxID=2876562 RepID=UPI001E63587D|nr:hypothetical protein [Methylobacterium sp. Leaf118]